MSTDARKIQAISKDPAVKLCLHCVHLNQRYEVGYKLIYFCQHPSNVLGRNVVTGGVVVEVETAAEYRYYETRCGKEGRLWADKKPPLTTLAKSKADLL